jgi:hypothetical protein
MRLIVSVETMATKGNKTVVVVASSTVPKLEEVSLSRAEREGVCVVG